MKSSVSIFLAISFTLLILACPSSDEKTKEDSKDGFEFRNTRWGMTLNEVRSSEASAPSEEKPDLIIYKEQYLGMPSTLGYVFIDGKLVKAGYLISDIYEDPEDYIKSYENIKWALIDDFGPPTLDEMRWLDEEKTDQTDASGKAVCRGDVLYKSEWMAGDTLITLLFEGDQGKCRQGVIFESKEHYLMGQEKK